MPLSGGLDEHTSAHDNGDPRVGEASNLTTQGTLRHEELRKLFLTLIHTMNPPNGKVQGRKQDQQHLLRGREWTPTDLEPGRVKDCSTVTHVIHGLCIEGKEQLYFMFIFLKPT